MGDADHMSNEITGNTAKEKSLDSTHIRSIVVLAMFSFVFLGTEFFYDNRAAEVVDARKVLLYQSVILLASVVGVFIYALIQKKAGDNIAKKVLIASNFVGVFALAGIMFGDESIILLYGIVFFIIWGMTGCCTYHVVAGAYTDRKHLTVTVGISYAAGLFLQYINYNVIGSMTIRLVVFILAVVVIVTIFMVYSDTAYAPEKIGDAEQSAGSKSIAFAFVIVILLMTFIFSELDNIVTLVHAEGGADIGQWPRLFLAISGIAAGLLFDIKDQRFMNQMMYCVTVLSVIAMLVIEFGGAFLIGLIVFYLAAGFFVVYFTTGFINVSYTMKWQSFWAGAGRTINNIGAGIVGVISYVIVKTPGIMAMSVTVILLLVFISIAVFVLESLQKKQYRQYDEEKVMRSSKSLSERTEVDFERFADMHGLTGREREVLQKLLISDESIQKIADELYISRASLYRHISSMNEKTGTKSRVGLIQYYYSWHEE